MKQYAPACERNSRPILEVLSPLLKDAGTVLEIGSGTGQHAVCFSAALPHVQWRPSDQPGATASVSAWRAESALPNLLEPLEIDLLNSSEWPTQSFDALVCINTVHIVSWEGVRGLFELASRAVNPAGVIYLYGPFRYASQALELSNEQFDQWLKQRDPDSGIRDFDALNQLAVNAGFSLEGDVAMPANNRSLWWRKGVNK